MLGSLVVRICQHCHLCTQQQRAEDDASTGIPREDADNYRENGRNYEHIGKHGCYTVSYQFNPITPYDVTGSRGAAER